MNKLYFFFANFVNSYFLRKNVPHFPRIKWSAPLPIMDSVLITLEGEGGFNFHLNGG